MNIIFDIYQMGSDEAEKNLKKKICNKEKPIKRKIIIEFFSIIFFIKIIPLLLFSQIKNQTIS
jgi:uncharacterized membrane protein YvbJ